MNEWLWIEAGLSVPALAGWWWVLRKSRPWRGVASDAGFGLGDVITASVLALFFLRSLFLPEGERPPVTRDLVTAVIVFNGFLILLVLGSLSLRGARPLAMFGLAVPPRQAGLAALAGAGLFLLTLPPVLALEHLILLAPAEGSDRNVAYLLSNPPAPDLALALLLAVVVAPLAEEIIFRGYLYGVARRYCGRFGAMGAVSLLFAAIHQNMPAMPAYWLLAIGLTLAYELTGSLWASIVMHVLFNLLTVAVIFFFPQLLMT